jgi:hypothetical protein
MKNFVSLAAALLTVIFLGPSLFAQNLFCAVSSAVGEFHSKNAPVTGDILRVDVEARTIGDSVHGIIFERPGSNELPYIPFFVGRVAPQSDEGARFQVSWLQPKAHLYQQLTFDKTFASGKFWQRWNTANRSDFSELNLSCKLQHK